MKTLFKNPKNLTEGSITKTLLAMAIPIIVANTLQSAYQFTDSFWVGRLGEKAVAAVAMSIPFIFLLTSLGIGLSIAGSILIAQYYGAKNKDMVNHAAAQTLLMVTFFSFFISILGFIFSPFILKFMGTAPEIFSNSLLYLRISFIGMIFNFCFFIFQSIMRSLGRPTVPVFIIIGTVLLNFILDPLFIFGFGPIQGIGVAGAALATVFTQSIAAFIGLSILFAGKRGIKLHIKNFKPDFPFIKKSFRLGFPSSVEQSMRSLGMIAMTSLVATFGTVAVASYGVAGNIVSFTVILAIGLSTAQSAIIGQNIGAGKMDRAEKTAKLTSLMTFGVMTGLGIIYFLFSKYLISFFVPNDPNVIATGAHFIRTTCLAFGFMGIQIVMGGVFQASGNTSTSMIITFISQWILQIPLAYLFSKYLNFGLNGVWFAFPISNVLIATTAFVIFKRGKWKHKKLIQKDLLPQKIMTESLAEEVIPYDA